MVGAMTTTDKQNKSGLTDKPAGRISGSEGEDQRNFCRVCPNTLQKCGGGRIKRNRKRIERSQIKPKH